MAPGMDDAELPNLGSEHGLGLDTSGQKHPEFANRPAGKQIFFLHFVPILVGDSFVCSNLFKYIYKSPYAFT